MEGMMSFYDPSDHMFFPELFLFFFDLFFPSVMIFVFLCLYSVNYCRFVHGKDTFGDDIESLFTGKELAKAFGDLGELEGEMMSYIICQWKEDPTQNHVFASGTRVLLSPYFLTVNNIVSLLSFIS
jgi:hypothetical protein